ncbi:MAG: aminopeptidase [Myxococcales bacterium SG8_38_1]|jgi:aspartyl aminopeptidase|nr:MAG: aminopeptidase [Myxococcales bacterium SG8_38_1]
MRKNVPVQDLLHYIDACPTPYHAVAETAARLEAAGYRRLDEADSWDVAPGDKVYLVRGGGSLAAFRVGSAPPSEAGFQLIGAHTDSPNLRIKPNPELRRSGYEQLGVEPYGGVLLHTWIDRDLSLAGRALLADGTARLVDFERALIRVPSLAIHLNRTVNTKGLVLNAQTHMAPLLALEGFEDMRLRSLLATELGDVDAQDILAWDLMAYDVQPATLSGASQEFIHAGRIDNLASCHAGLTALLAVSSETEATRGIVLYDHEEVGSRSAQGAASDFLRSCLQRLSGGAAEGYHRAVAKSFLISADMAHAIHPNYADMHEPKHQPLLGAGPVVKLNVNQSYATDGESWARFERSAAAAEVTTQRFVVRSDLGCGSTIGPITAAQLGIRTVDVGNPMLSMHSCREVAAAADVPKMIDVMKRFFDAS